MFTNPTRLLEAYGYGSWSEHRTPPSVELDDLHWFVALEERRRPALAITSTGVPNPHTIAEVDEFVA